MIIDRDAAVEAVVEELTFWLIQQKDEFMPTGGALAFVNDDGTLCASAQVEWSTEE